MPDENWRDELVHLLDWSHTDPNTLTTMHLTDYPYGGGDPRHGVQVTVSKPQTGAVVGGEPNLMVLRMPAHTVAEMIAAVDGSGVLHADSAAYAMPADDRAAASIEAAARAMAKAAGSQAWATDRPQPAGLGYERQRFLRYAVAALAEVGPSLVELGRHKAAAEIRAAFAFEVQRPEGVRDSRSTEEAAHDRRFVEMAAEVAEGAGRDR